MKPDDRVIDPSEILIDRSGTVKEDAVHANPWVRFLARFFDYALFLLVLWGLRELLHGKYPLGKYESMVPFEFFVWIPIEALLLWSWGTTPGKFFLKMKLQQGRRFKLDFATALRRSFNVWFRGLGMMIPIVNCICMALAYYRLKSLQYTSWDRDDHIAVSHGPIGQWRIVVSALVAAAVLLFYYANKNHSIS